MIDIVFVQNGKDLGAVDTDVHRAKNILSTQIGDLVYAPTLGIDLKYFLSDEFKFQNSSFRAYLIQVLASYSINVASIVDTIDNLSEQYTINLSASDSEKTLIAR